MAKHIIDYYYAPISGYAYLGEQTLVELAERYDCEIRFKPVDIARVFSESGTTPPFKQSPQRLQYRLHDLKRCADQLGLAINPKPKYWPVPVELPAKTILYAQAQGLDTHKVSFALLEAVYAKEMNLSEWATIAEILETLDLSAETFEQGIQTDEVQALYEQCTQDAIAFGIFGSPSYVLDGEELYFGQDRLAALTFTLSNHSADTDSAVA